jgi:AmiR/NasT family two-component response regulator
VNPQAEASAIPTEQGRSATVHRVLVAEDEALIRLDLVEMLSEEGYVVAGEAADGLQAVEQAEALRPDLVIMDVKMPKMDGIDAASIIAERTSGDPHRLQPA